MPPRGAAGHELEGLEAGSCLRPLDGGLGLSLQQGGPAAMCLWDAAAAAAVVAVVAIVGCLPKPNSVFRSR